MFTETNPESAQPAAMSSPLPFQKIQGQELSPEQRSYLEGLFCGLRERGFAFNDVEPKPDAKEASLENLIFEERVKRELPPLDAFPQILENAGQNSAPDRESTFRFKWHGLFFLAPGKEAFMARLRIPAGQLRSFQLRELARIAKELTSGYVQITTRANLQLRLIKPKDTPEFLQRIQSIGLHTRGAGADNVRNLTVNPTAGIDPYELIDTTPFCHELAQVIINDRSFYDLPRKFNIAFDGGGLIGTVEDTNDIGVSAVELLRDHESLKPGIYFRACAGGATGHKAFARDLGVLIPRERLVKVLVAML